MSSRSSRVTLWLATTLAVAAVFLFLALQWATFADRASDDASFGLAVLLALLFLVLCGCAYLSPFLPRGGIRRHLAAVGLGALACGGWLLAGAGVARLLWP